MRGSQLEEKKFEPYLRLLEPRVLNPLLPWPPFAVSLTVMCEPYLDLTPPPLFRSVSWYDGGGMLGGKNFWVGVDGCRGVSTGVLRVWLEGMRPGLRYSSGCTSCSEPPRCEERCLISSLSSCVV